MHTTKVNWAVVRSQFNQFQDSESTGENVAAMDFESITNGPQDSVAMNLDNIQRYSERLGATLAAATGHAFVNGKHFNVDDVRWSC
jgi:hypothetical protein